MSEDWVREMTEIEQRISRMQDDMLALLKRRERLSSILAGPRVDPVVVSVVYGEVEELHDFTDLADAVCSAYYMVQDGRAWVRSVSVGGAVLTEDEREAILEAKGIW